VKTIALMLGLAIAFVVPVRAAEPVRIDATTEKTAEATWDLMLKELPAAKRQALIVAMLKVNLTGVNSAGEIAANPELHSMGIARIKDKVAGMTADEIIALGERSTTLKAYPAHP